MGEGWVLCGHGRGGAGEVNMGRRSIATFNVSRGSGKAQYLERTLARSIPVSRRPNFPPNNENLTGQSPSRTLKGPSGLFRSGLELLSSHLPVWRDPRPTTLWTTVPECRRRGQQRHDSKADVPSRPSPDPVWGHWRGFNVESVDAKPLTATWPSPAATPAGLLVITNVQRMAFPQLWDRFQETGPSKQAPSPRRPLRPHRCIGRGVHMRKGVSWWGDSGGQVGTPRGCSWETRMNSTALAPVGKTAYPDRANSDVRGTSSGGKLTAHFLYNPVYQSVMGIMQGFTPTSHWSSITKQTHYNVL